MSQEQRLKVVHSAGNPAEAEIVQAILEEANIYSVIPDQNVPLPGIDLNPLDPQGIAACQVLVREEDEARAKEAIREARERGRVGGDAGESDGGE